MDTAKTTNIPDKGLEKITNVLIFKDGFYYLTIEQEVHTIEELFRNRKRPLDCYQIVPDEWRIFNGFEFASDAYKYKAELADREVKKNEVQA